jgi:hypothetical protein
LQGLQETAHRQPIPQQESLRKLRENAAPQGTSQGCKARAEFSVAAETDPTAIRRWLKKSKSDVFDSKAFFQ